jgi:hypothetical protein
MSLTLPTPVSEVDNKRSLYKALEGMSIINSEAQLTILDHEFFKGLDHLFLDLLFPSFQTFGVVDEEVPGQYDQNNAPSLEEEDDDDENDKAEKSASQKEMLCLDWSDKYWNAYVPAVTKFVREWVVERKKVLKQTTEVAALDALEGKMVQFLAKKYDTVGFPMVDWHMDGVGVPLVTPMFVSALLKELNDVEEAAISVSKNGYPQVPWNLLTTLKDADAARTDGMVKNHEFPRGKCQCGNIRKGPGGMGQKEWKW